MKKIYLLTFIVVLFGCSTKEVTTEATVTSTEAIENQEENSLFHAYINSLEKISLPLNHSTTGNLPELSRNYDKKGFEKYKHIWANGPLGILFENKFGIVTIDYSIADTGPAPFIMSYDLRGNKIDSLGVYQKSGSDMGYEAVEYLSISYDRIVTVIDSTRQWAINKEGVDIVEGTMKLTVDTTIYQIDKIGKITKKSTASKN